MKKITCHDGKQIQITDEEANKIYYLSSIGKNSFLLKNGDYITFSNIARIEKIHEEYQNFPELPERILDPIKSDEKRKRALEGMIKGLKKYINSSENKGTGKPEILLKTMEEKLC